MAEGGIERLTLAFLGVGETAPEEPDPLTLVALDDASRAVARRVVDHQDGDIVGGQTEQALEAPFDHQVLVQARQHENEEEPVGGRQ